MVATLNNPQTLYARPDSRTDILMALGSRFQRVLQNHAYSLPESLRFMCIGFTDRAVFAVRLSYLGGSIPPKLVTELRAKMDGRMVVAGIHHDPRIPLAIFQVSYTPQAERHEPLPAFAGRQIVVYGPTGTGKTTVLQKLLQQRQGTAIVLDPHYAAGKGKWHPQTLVIGAGRRFDEIEAALEILVAEMGRRYQQAAQGHEQFTPFNIAVDELSAFAHNISSGASNLITIAQEGRKVGMFVILTPHSPEVRQMGFEGKGGARDNFAFIRMPTVRPGQERAPRVVTVYYGNPMTTEPDGRYLVTAPQVYQGEPRLVSAKELARLLGVSQGVSEVSEGVSGGVSAVGHGQDTGKSALLAFEERYAKGTDAARALAEMLAVHGFGVKKISMVLPYRAEDARMDAAQAAGTVQRGVKPAFGSAEEADLVRDLYHTWGVPANRIARLLDGADHENLSRIQAILNGVQQ